MSDTLNDLKAIWERPEHVNQDFVDKDTIRKATELKSRSVSRKLGILIKGSVVLVTINGLLLIINLVGYQGNTSILLTLVTFCFLCIVSAIILKNGWQTLSRIDNSLLDLRRNILEKIKFYQKYLSPIIHILSFLLICLSLSINLIVDNNEGNFEINKPWLNILLYFTAYIGAYFYYRHKFSFYLHQLKTSANDLESNVLTDMDLANRKQRWITIFVLTFILIILIMGIIILFLR